MIMDVVSLYLAYTNCLDFMWVLLPACLFAFVNLSFWDRHRMQWFGIFRYKTLLSRSLPESVYVPLIYVQVLPAILFVKANNAELCESSRFQRLAHSDLSERLKKKKMKALIPQIVQIIYFGALFILCAGSLLVSSGNFDACTMVSFISSLVFLIEPIQVITFVTWVLVAHLYLIILVVGIGFISFFSRACIGVSICLSLCGRIYIDS